MPSAAVIDIDALLAPISDDTPTGTDCRMDPSPTSYYQQIKSARNAARSAERNNMYSGSSDEADEHWRTVLGMAPKILAEQSKDLEVASWLAEALIRRYGFGGLRDIFVVLDGFVEQFWDNLYPMPDEDGIETRVSPIAGLNGEGAEGVLLAPIRNTLITEGSSVGPFTYWEYHQAVEAQRLTDQEAREDKIRKLGYSLADVEKAVSESGSGYFVNLRDDLTDAIASFKSLGQRLDELCGAYDAPPTRNILNILEECLGAVNHLGQDKFPVAAPEPELAADEGAGEGGDVTPQAPTSGGALGNKAQAYQQVLHIAEFLRRNDPSSPVSFMLEQTVKSDSVAASELAREQMFRQLSEIAEFFRKTEPHSPVSYVLEKAVKWGNLSLQELVKELIPDQSSQSHFAMLTGVPTEE